MADKTVVVGITLGCVMLGGYISWLIHHGSALQAGEQALKDTFTMSSEGTLYRLEGAHTVTADYGPSLYTFNFDPNNRSVFASKAPQGAHGGGVTSFQGFNNPAGIEKARTMGCAIAARSETAVNPGYPVTDRFSEALKHAAWFKARYCP